MTHPPKRASNPATLRLTYYLYSKGCKQDAKLSLAKLLAVKVTMKKAWFFN